MTGQALLPVVSCSYEHNMTDRNLMFGILALKLLLLFRSRPTGRTAARLITHTIRPRFVEAENRM